MGNAVDLSGDGDTPAAAVPCPCCNGESKVRQVTWGTNYHPGECLGMLISADGRLWEQVTNRIETAEDREARLQQEQAKGEDA